ncbi:MAG: Tol-Pal system protein TolB [Alphaproteobacteria bacterium]|nr:Tol-Pal system protein TolB [Alphaproteobacteria bacterium]
MKIQATRRTMLRGGAMLLGGLASATALRPAQAQLRIDITRGRVEPMPIAVSPFFAAQEGERQYGDNIPQVVADDLERSGLFRPLPRASFTQQPAAMRNTAPRFGDWRQIGAQALVNGGIEIQRDGRVKVEFRLWDVTSGQQQEGQVYTTTAQNWRRIAHIIADAIYKRITGEDGYFDTRIVFVTESGPAQRRIKRLTIMDQDGANVRYLTDGSELVLTPRFSPNSQDVTYLGYVSEQRPRVYMMNIDSGQRAVLGDFQGMTFAPRFAPDGNRVIFSVSENGLSDIWTYDTRSRARQRLTNGPGINTAPCFSPDGRQVVFESDRGGSQQLYVMNSDGSNARRISFGQGRYATPVWSPRGDLIAFTRQGDGGFAIGVMRPDGSQERLLSNAFLAEGPTWSPNGRVIMFFRQSGGGAQPRLVSIDVTGYNEREVRTPGAASDPAWSPLIP